jgi:anti-anti-sigma regulatory factor
MNMQWTITTGVDGTRVVTISGNVTEHADFRALAAPLASAQHIKIDLAGIELINSPGVRGWIHFMRDLANDDRVIELLRCSPVIVQQLSTIANFRGTGHVCSVMLPYVCVACAHEFCRELNVEDGFSTQDIDTEVPCVTCSANAEFDDIAERYASAAAPRRPSTVRPASLGANG